MDDDFKFDVAERLATLEALVAQGKEDRRDIKESIEQLSQKLSPMIDKMNKWEAKFGAFFFIVGCVWTFFIASWKIILVKLGLGVQ
jgi:CRISPR/Cas system CSM-associated protein Csm2 small subunit